MGNPLQPAMTAPIITPVPPPLSTSTQLPASSLAPGSTTDAKKATSDFSAVDAARVVMRGLSTVTECFCFVGRKVTVYAVTLGGWFVGGLKGLLRYAHENLSNRTVQPAPGQTHNQTPNRTVPENMPEKIPGKMPWEEYVREDATKLTDSLSKSVLATNPKNHWLSVEGFGGIACAFLTPWFFFGPLGTLLNLPRLCGAEPFITFDTPSDTSQKSPPAPPLQAPSPADLNPQRAQPDLPVQQLPQSESITRIIEPSQNTQSSQQNTAGQPAQTGQNNQQSGPPPVASEPFQYPVNTQVPQPDPQNFPSQIVQQSQFSQPAPQQPITAHPTQQALAQWQTYSYQPIQPGPIWHNMPSTFPYFVAC